MSSDHLDFLILLHVSNIIFPDVTTESTGYNEVNAFFPEYHPQRQLPVQTPCGFEIHTSLKKSSQLLLHLQSHELSLSNGALQCKDAFWK